MQKPFQISRYWKVHRKILVPGEERQPVTAETLQEPLVFNDCVRLLQKRIEESEFPEGRAPYACLPEEFAHEIWEQISQALQFLASYPTIRWDKVFQKSGLPIEEEFRANMFASYKAVSQTAYRVQARFPSSIVFFLQCLMPLKIARKGWWLLMYRNGRITYCESRSSLETEIDLGLTSDLRSSGFELVSRIKWLIHHASY
jgi:hypothetical protein